MLMQQYSIRHLDNAHVNSIGNAKISEMQYDLNLSSNQYSISLVVFFVGYVVFEIPSKYVSPSPG
jgi:hypothetical protein